MRERSGVGLGWKCAHTQRAKAALLRAGTRELCGKGSGISLWPLIGCYKSAVQSWLFFFFFFPFPPPFLSFILFVLIAILVLTGGEHELVSLVTKSVRHPHKVGMCEVQTFSFLEKLWALKTSAVGQQCVFSGSRSRKSCVCHMQIYS